MACFPLLPHGLYLAVSFSFRNAWRWKDTHSERLSGSSFFFLKEIYYILELSEEVLLGGDHLALSMPGPFQMEGMERRE